MARDAALYFICIQETMQCMKYRPSNHAGNNLPPLLYPTRTTRCSSSSVPPTWLPISFTRDHSLRGSYNPSWVGCLVCADTHFQAEPICLKEKILGTQYTLQVHEYSSAKYVESELLGVWSLELLGEVWRARSKTKT